MKSPDLGCKLHIRRMAALPAMIASSEGSTTYRKDLLTSAEIAGKLMREGRDEDLAIYRDSPDLQTPSSEIAGSRFGEFRRISPVYIRQISPDLTSADFAGSRRISLRQMSPDLTRTSSVGRSHCFSRGSGGRGGSSGARKVYAFKKQFRK